MGDELIVGFPALRAWTRGSGESRARGVAGGVGYGGSLRADLRMSDSAIDGLAGTYRVRSCIDGKRAGVATVEAVETSQDLSAAARRPSSSYQAIGPAIRNAHLQIFQGLSGRKQTRVAALRFLGSQALFPNESVDALVMLCELGRQGTAFWDFKQPSVEGRR